MTNVKFRRRKSEFNSIRYSISNQRFTDRHGIEVMIGEQISDTRCFVRSTTGVEHTQTKLSLRAGVRLDTGQEKEE